MTRERSGRPGRDPNWTESVLTRLLALQRRTGMVYGLALALFAVALALRFALEGTLPPGFPFLTFFPAVVLSAALCGTGPAILCATLSGFAAWWFFIGGGNHLPLNGASLMAMGFYVFIVGLDIFLIDGLMRAMLAIRDERSRSRLYAEQRDILFRELQHRVSNNLQAVSAILAIQSRSLVAPEARRVIEEAQQRISTIADIQRQFLDPDRTAGILDEDFVRSLVERCVHAAGKAGVETGLKVEPLSLQQQSFVAVALVLTECVNNAIEHAFSGEGPHRLSIRIGPAAGEAENVLTVADNGPGLPPGFELARARSVGLDMIKAFARQIGGSFTMRDEDGTVCELKFRA